MRNHLIPGNWNALCDSCGRKFKALDLKRRWDGLMVCKEDYELRHESDFLRVQKEKITVEFSRPYPSTDTFVPIVWACTLESSVGVAGRGIAGCSIAGSYDGIRAYSGAVAGKAIANFAITGTQ